MFFHFPEIVNVIDGADYINHCREWKYYTNNLKYSRSTSAHECSHGIHATLRNQSVTLHNHCPVPGVRQAGFYVGQNRAILLPEPRCRKRDAIPYIPTDMREHRYSTYVTGQQAWDDTPSYLFDEFVAYCNGTEVAIATGDGRNTDAALGPIEFMVYCTGLMSAIKELDPESYTAWLDFYYFCMSRAHSLSSQALELFPWDSATQILSKINETYRDYYVLPAS